MRRIRNHSLALLLLCSTFAPALAGDSGMPPVVCPPGQVCPKLAAAPVEEPEDGSTDSALVSLFMALLGGIL